MNKVSLPKNKIDMNNKSIINIKPDSQDAAAYNIKWVRDFIINIIYDIFLSNSLLRTERTLTPDDQIITAIINIDF